MQSDNLPYDNGWRDKVYSTDNGRRRAIRENDTQYRLEFDGRYFAHASTWEGAAKFLTDGLGDEWAIKEGSK